MCASFYLLNNMLLSAQKYHLFMLLYYKNMLEQDTQNCLRERKKERGGREGVFVWSIRELQE